MDDLADRLFRQSLSRGAIVRRRWSEHHKKASAKEEGRPKTPFEERMAEPIGSDGQGGINVRDVRAVEDMKRNANVLVTPSGLLTSRSLLEARSKKTVADRISASFAGSALGDALGAETEFMTVEQILERWPPVGPTNIKEDHRQITDDTQMAIAVARAILSLPDGEPDLQVLSTALTTEFVSWLRSPDNDRAPGNTCISAVTALELGASWLDATVVGSKGCGANMRVHPVAYRWWRKEDDRLRSRVSQFQASLTHGHPTALAASDATSLVTALLIRGVPAHEVLEAVLDYSKRPPAYDAAWLGDLWERAGASSPADFVDIGWAETRESLERIMVALVEDDGFSDPCIPCGDGWIAEEALSTGLYCFLAHCWDQMGSRDALRRAAVTRGDSDSIACLTGAFVGACDGTQAWPLRWLRHLEREPEIDVLSKKLAAANS